MQSFTQLFILRGYADRAHTAAADTVLLACGGYHCRGSHRDGVRAHGDRLGKIGGYPQAPCDDQIDIGTDRIQIFSRAVERIERRYAGGVPDDGGGCARRAASAVYGDEVGFRVDTKLQILFNAPCGDFNTNWSAVAQHPQICYHAL